MDSKFLHKKAAKGNENVELGETTIRHTSTKSEISLTPFLLSIQIPQENGICILKSQEAKRHQELQFQNVRLTSKKLVLFC